MSNAQDITRFLQAAVENEHEILAREPEMVGYLEEIHDLFRGLAGKHLSGDPLCVFLLMNAHASFLSAVRIALSGQSPPVFMVLRGCIEKALFALIARSDESTKMVWLEREKDRQKCRSTFTARKGLAILRTLDPNLATYVDSCYEASIEFGAHPNKRSILDHIIFDQDTAASEQRARLIYVSGAGSLQVVRTLSACVETGLAALLLSPHILPNHESAIDTHGRACEVSLRFQAWLQQEGLLADDGGARQ